MTKAEFSRFMAEIGRKGGKVGGKRRLVAMSPEERSRIASIAAKARWKKHQQTPSQQISEPPRLGIKAALSKIAVK